MNTYFLFELNYKLNIPCSPAPPTHLGDELSFITASLPKMQSHSLQGEHGLVVVVPHLLHFLVIVVVVQLFPCVPSESLTGPHLSCVPHQADPTEGNIDISVCVWVKCVCACVVCAVCAVCACAVYARCICV